MTASRASFGLGRAESLAVTLFRHCVLFVLVAITFQAQGATPAPSYPELARLKRESGRVTLTIDFASDGSVARCRVSGSSGFATLDDYSRGFILKNWSDVRYAGKTISLPITYEFHHTSALYVLPDRKRADQVPRDIQYTIARGQLILACLFAQDGRVIDAKIARSSGIEAEDEQAVRWAESKYRSVADAGKTAYVTVDYREWSDYHGSLP